MAQTRTACSGTKRTNHEVITPLPFASKNVIEYIWRKFNQAQICGRDCAYDYRVAVNDLTRTEG